MSCNALIEQYFK